MTPMDAAWHLLNAVAAPFWVSLITVALCAALGWPRSIRRQPAHHFLVAYLFGVTAHVAAWWWLGAEGTMIGYALMVAAIAVTLWFRTCLRS